MLNGVSKHIAQSVKQRLRLPVRQIQFDRPTVLAPDTLLLFSEDSHISPTEAVDRLAHVADNKQAPSLACQGVDNVALVLVGVLVLIYHDRLEFLLPARADILALQELLGIVFQVVKVVCLAFLCLRLVSLVDEGEGTAQ